jgi:DnaJ-class molecular chaperone
MQTIQLAWETLRDDTKRHEYDERLLILENDKKSCVYDEVSFSEFEEMISGQRGFHLPCRCGGEFFIEMDDLCKGFNLISCSNCTARVLVK